MVETIENEHNQSFQLEKQEQIILFNLHKYFQQRVISVRKIKVIEVIGAMKILGDFDRCSDVLLTVMP